MGKKVLYISGSLGLGHIFRDLAIVKELRKLKPDIDLYWLAEQPVTDLLTKAGEKVLPESYSVCNELMRKQVDEKNQVNFTRWLYAWSKFFDKTFQDYMNILRRENFDLVIGDEAYELAIGYSKKPELLDRHFVMMWDFVKVYPMTKNPIDHIIAWVVNQNWDRHYKMKETPYLHNIFFGELEDAPDERLGLFLVNARDWGKKYCDFVGHPLQFDPKQYADPALMKERLGYGRDPLILCAIGGTSAGAGLLGLCKRAYPIIRRALPNARMVIVGGPSIQLGSEVIPDGVEMRGYVPKLYEHFAACDLAIVLGGGGTTLELAALHRPFIYFPLEKHSEQMISVARMLDRYGAGNKMLFSRTSPEMLAEKAISCIGQKVEYGIFPTDGALRSAEIISKLIQ